VEIGTLTINGNLGLNNGNAARRDRGGEGGRRMERADEARQRGEPWIAANLSTNQQRIANLARATRNTAPSVSRSPRDLSNQS
jgi:hypothetical protein